MPYTRTWSEELVAEWLQLEGYFVEVSVPIGVTPKGGRNEADVLGIRIENHTLQIMHVEIGVLGQSAKINIQTVQDKFSIKNQNAIKGYCKKKLGFSGRVSYDNLYVATYVGKKTLGIAKRNNINLKHMDDFIYKDVVPAINTWKQNPQTGSKTKGKTITLPDGLWLLQLIDYTV